MASQLISVVRFAALAVGVPAVLPHGLNQDDRALIPDEVLANAEGFTIVVDATSVTVTRLLVSDPAAVDVMVKSWHTILREFGPYNPPPGAAPSGSLTPQPFIVAGGASAFSANFVYSVAQVTQFTLTDVPAGVVLVDADESDYFLLVGQGGGSTRQLDNPTNLIAGTRRVLVFEYQHGGAGSLTFDTLYEFGAPGAPTYVAAGVRDIITAIWNGSVLLCSYVQEYAT